MNEIGLFLLFRVTQYTIVILYYIFSSLGWGVKALALVRKKSLSNRVKK